MRFAYLLVVSAGICDLVADKLIGFIDSDGRNWVSFYDFLHVQVVAFEFFDDIKGFQWIPDRAFNSWFHCFDKFIEAEVSC